MDNMNVTRRNELVNYLVEKDVEFIMNAREIIIKGEQVNNNVLMELAVNYNAYFNRDEIYIALVDAHEED